MILESCSKLVKVLILLWSILKMTIINTELKAGEDLFVLIQKIFGKCSSLEHVFLPDGFKKLISAVLGKKRQERPS